MRRATIKGVVLITILFAGSAICRADITGVNTRGEIQADAQVANATNPADPNPAQDNDRPPDKFDITAYNKTAMASATKEGRQAAGKAQQQTQVTILAKSVSLRSTSSTEATATRTGDPVKDHFTGSDGSTVFSVSFVVTQSSHFSLTGSAKVITNGVTDSSESEVELSGSADDGTRVDFDFNAEDAPGISKSVTIGKSGTLKPGSYTLFLFSLSTIGDTQASSKTSWDVTFNISEGPPPTPTPTPTPSPEAHWKTAVSGSFSTSDNWNPAFVPNNTKTAIFDVSGVYNVDLGSAVTKQTKVLNGTVTFSGGTLTAIDTSAPGLLVGGSTSQLTLASGTLRTFGDAVIAGTDPAMNINANARLEVAPTAGGELKVGDITAGKGALHFQDRGAGSAAKLFIGKGGQIDLVDPTLGGISVGGSAAAANAQLDIAREVHLSDGGKLTTVSGVVSGAAGTTVSVAGQGSLWFIDTLSVDSTFFKPLVVGDATRGLLEISGGGRVEDNVQVVVGNIIGSHGELTISGKDADGHPSTLTSSILLLGHKGSAVVNVTDGGLISTNVLQMGDSHGGSGALNLTGLESKLEMNEPGEARLGKAGVATLTVAGGAQISFPDSASSGIGLGTAADGAGEGTLNLDGKSGSGIPSKVSTNGLLKMGGAGGGRGVMNVTAGAEATFGFARIGLNAAVHPSGGLPAVLRISGGTMNFTSSTGEGSQQDLFFNIGLVIGEDGELLVENGGKLISITAVFGGTTGGQGSALITGSGSQWTTQSLFVVGDFAPVLRITETAVVNATEFSVGGRGIAQLSGGAQLNTTTGSIGVPLFGLTPSNAGMSVTGAGSVWSSNTITIGTSSGLPGAGFLQIDSGGVVNVTDLTVEKTGVVDGNGGVLHATHRVVNGGKIAPGLSPGILTIEGDFEQIATGLLEMEIGPSASDQLVINGAAQLGGKLVLKFIDGFAPKQGDQFELLQVGGAMTGDFSEVEVKGLAPGFQFEAADNGTTLILTALNDGITLPMKGSFRSLLRNDLSSNEGTGFFSINTNSRGGFSGRLVLGGRAFGLHGVFDQSGKFSKTILRKGQSPLFVQLELDSTDGVRIVTGSIRVEGISIPISAELATAFDKSHPAPQAGRYTMLVQHDASAPDSPQAEGVGTVRVDAAGRLRFVGALADGTPVSQGTTLSAAGEWPLYLALYKQQGSLAGEILFKDESGTDFDGTLEWSKPARPLDRFYPGGFAAAPTAIGSIYVPPASGFTALDFSNGGTATLSDGNLTAAFTKSITMAPPAILAVLDPGAELLSLNASGAMGTFTGKFKHSVTGTLTPLRGVLFQKLNFGAGFYLGTDLAGSIELEPKP